MKETNLLENLELLYLTIFDLKIKQKLINFNYFYKLIYFCSRIFKNIRIQWKKNKNKLINFNKMIERKNRRSLTHQSRREESCT